MGASVRVDTEDWPSVIMAIRGKGMLAKAIARHAGIAPSTLNNLTTGATREPVYSVGVRILALREKMK